MISKSKILILALICILSLGVLAGMVQAEDKITIKFAHPGPPNALELPEQSGAICFENYVESVSGGNIEVVIFPDCQLGSEREMLEGVQMGSIEMANTSEGALAGFYKDILATAIPYAFKNRNIAWEVFNSDYGIELREDIRQKTGMRCLAISDNGFRNFTNDVRPVQSPEDLQGLKIRTMENPAHMKLVNSLGGQATPIAWAETYTALQQGIVDGQENPVSLIVAKKFYEVQKYCTLDGHVFSIDFIWINDDFYKSLPPNYQQIVKDGAKQAALVQRGMKLLTHSMGVNTLKEKGMEIYTPTDEELKMFREKTQQPVIDWIKTQISSPEKVEEFLAAIEEAEAKLAVD